MLQRQQRWIQERNIDQISRWSLDECHTFLFLSETTQRKLPGAKTAGEARDKVKDRILKLVQQVENKDNDNELVLPTTLSPREILCADILDLHHKLLEHLVQGIPDLPLLRREQADDFDHDLVQSHQLISIILNYVSNLQLRAATTTMPTEPQTKPACC